MGVKIKDRDGAWWVFVNHRGHRTARRVGPGTAGKKAAQTAAIQIEARLALGDVGVLEKPKVAPKPSAFAAVAGAWEELNSPNWKQGTQITYHNLLTHRILPTFGATPVAELTEDAIEQWWAHTRADGLSKKRLQILRKLFTDICQRAVDKDLLPKNPARCIQGKLGREDREGRTADYLVVEDLAKLLEAAERLTRKEYPVFLVMATAGLRIGEAVALQVGDLDAVEHQVHIRRTTRRGYVSSPKNGKIRVVDVPATTMAVLAQVRQTRQAEAAYTGKEARWLFPGRTEDKPITPEMVAITFRRLLRLAGIRKIRPHDLRHTYATLAIKAGVPLLTVSRQLGHSSIAITADIYAHAVPGSNRAAAEALETILAGCNRPQPPRNPHDASNLSA